MFGVVINMHVGEQEIFTCPTFKISHFSIQIILPKSIFLTGSYTCPGLPGSRICQAQQAITWTDVDFSELNPKQQTSVKNLTNIRNKENVSNMLSHIIIQVT